MKNSKILSLGYPRLLAGLMLCLLILACISDSKGDNTARHGWAGSNGIVVPHDTFPSDCLLCHLEGSWNELRGDFSFDHELETGVPLNGAHQDAQCLRCHNDRGPVTRFSQQGCAGCHEDIHRAELGDQCSSCHGEETWALRDEIALHNRTRFPLVGSHASAQCWTCHPGGEVGNWTRVDVDCTTCHGEEALAVTNPNHAANGWIMACDRCHIPTTWSGGGFNHATFALTGAHRTTDCNQCHINDVFVGIPRDCAGCHTPEYQATTDPDHALMGFPLTCELCHDTSSWEGALFSHAGINNGCVVCHQADYDGTNDPDHAANGFSTACEQCHGTLTWEGGNFQHQGIVNGCVNCHLADYNATTSPDHVATGISQSCEQCHVTTTWLGASFDHVGIVNGCAVCHQPEYNNTTDPNHAAAGVGTNCEQCHGTDFWRPANMSHVGIATSCAVCHQADYNATTDPNHQAAGVSTTCEQCHGTNAWDPANMNHAGIATNCAVCHITEYNQTTQPNHIAAGFPTTCETCHGTNNWTPANFNHSFPINGGAHSGISCDECHLQPNNFRSFSCIDCHEHNQSDMASDHQGENGYSWTTAACYGCHPNGTH